jgi:hypothetical protein
MGTAVGSKHQQQHSFRNKHSSLTGKAKQRNMLRSKLFSKRLIIMEKNDNVIIPLT